MTDYSDYINDYISGQLTQDKRLKFEEALERDPSLYENFQIVLKSREYLKAQSMLNEIENDPELKRAERMVDEWHKKDKAKTKKKSRTRRIILISLPAAAAIAGLIVVFSILSQANYVDRLYSRYYEPLLSERAQSTIVRGDGNLHRRMGLDYYMSGQYNLALQQFEIAGASDFYLGLAYLGLEDYQSALNHLEKFHQKYPDHQDANWYLGLAYLQMEMPIHAMEQFQRVYSTTNIYQKDAEKLVKIIVRRLR